MPWTFFGRTFGNNVPQGGGGSPPVAATLAVNAVGTLATISGGDGAATNTVYTAPAAGGSWTSQGSVAGAGSVALTLSAGGWWAYAESVTSFGGTPSNLVFFSVPVAGGIHHYESLLGVQAVVQALGLTGLTGATPLPGSRVYLRKLPTDRTLTLPCVLVTLVPVPEGVETIVTVAEDYGYPVYLAMVVANNQDLTVVESELGWRQQIRNAFNNKKPVALISALTVPLKLCKWEPAPVLDLDLWKSENLFVSAAVVRVITREVRP